MSKEDLSIQEKLDVFIEMFDKEEAAQAIARHFFQSMAESQQLIAYDNEDYVVPTKEVFQNMAVDYGVDMVNDFTTDVRNAIYAVKEQIVFTAKETRSVNIDVEFY